MAFDEQLSTRIRNSLGKKKGLLEEKMFDGLSFLLRGNMCVGVQGSEMIVRMDPDQTDDALAQKHTRIFDLSGGRPMKGWILVGPAGIVSDAALARWVETGVKFAESLPP